MSSILVLAIIAAVAVALRCIPGAVWKRDSSDAGYHLLLRREIRRNHGRMPARIAAMDLDERQTYPWLYHAIIAAIPEAWLLRVPGLTSAAFDAAQVVVAWMVAGAAAGAAAEAAPLLAAAFVATSPVLLAAGIGPRAYDITPRPFGELLWCGGVAATGAYVSGSVAFPALILAVACFSAALLASKFAAQVLLFCLPLLAVFTGHFSLLLMLPATLAGAIVLSGGRYLDVFRGQIVHLALYRRRLQYEHPSLINRAQWRELAKAIAHCAMTGPRDRLVLKRALVLIEGNGWIQMMLRNVVLVQLLPAAAAGFASTTNSWEHFLWGTSFVTLVPACLTMLRGFRFLGEAERYLEYGVVPSSVLLALILSRSNVGWRTSFLAVYALVAVTVYGWALVRRAVPVSADPPGSLEEVRAFLTALPSGTRLLTVPSVNLAFSLAWQLDHRFLTAMDSFVWAREYDVLFRQYPWPSTDIDRWQTRYGAEYVVASRFYMAPQSGCTWDYALKPSDLVFENAGYVVYQLPRAAVETPTCAARAY